VTQLLRFPPSEHPGVVRQHGVGPNTSQRLAEHICGVFVAAQLAEDIPQVKAGLGVLPVGAHGPLKKAFCQPELVVSRLDPETHANWQVSGRDELLHPRAGKGLVEGTGQEEYLRILREQRKSGIHVDLIELNLPLQIRDCGSVPETNGVIALGLRREQTQQGSREAVGN
jgi:hypothetical protein